MHEVKQDSPVKTPERSLAPTSEATRETTATLPHLRNHHPLLQLQRKYGNRHVQRMVELSRKGEGEAGVAPEVEAGIEQVRGSGQPLDRAIQRQMESAFGTNFSGVRVHTDSGADTLNHALNARAFTTGQDIFFRQGEYNPGTSSGKELLAHELTHVVQQTGGIQAKLAVGQPNDVYEQEADQVAQAIVQRQPEQSPDDEVLESTREEPVEQEVLASGSGQPASPVFQEESMAVLQSKPYGLGGGYPVIQRQLTEAGVAAAALGYEILTGAIATMNQGDLQVTWPTSDVGVIAQNPPPGVRQRTLRRDEVIFRYRSANPISGIEQVNIGLRCIVEYNGPEVKATFGFTANGTRSRIMRDSQVNIRNPVNLRTFAASPEWQRAGVPEHPVVRVPIEIHVDHPWPQSNFHSCVVRALWYWYHNSQWH
jgi:Domain of unknown function (DUF4157)